MDLTQILTVFMVIATNLGTVITLYSMSDKKTEEHRKETTQILLGIQQEITAFQKSMAQESKDFHGRLCAIEERNKK